MTDTAGAAPSEREQFEAWAKSHGTLHTKDKRGNYQYTPTSAMWKAWQAARAQPTPPAVVEPLTPIRAAAFDLYTPPFRHDHGYIRDSNHQMVADDAGDTMVGVIAARIRGWGRIQYMDNQEWRAGALQDEVAEMVADALNRYWAAHGIGIKKENGNG